MVAPARNFWGATWTDGDVAVYVPSNAGGLWAVPAFGGTPEQLTSPGRGEGHRFPSALPGGKAVLFVVRRGARMEDSDIGILDLDSGEWRVLVERAMAPAYVNGGYLVFARDGAIFAMHFDPESGNTAGAAVPVVEDVGVHVVHGAAAFAVGYGDRLYYATSGQRTAYQNRIVIVDRDGTRTPTPCRPGPIWDVIVTPDAQTAIFTRDETGPTEMWTCALESGSVQQLTHGSAAWVPVWSPEGIYFQSNVTGTGNVWRAPLRQGTAAVPVLEADELQYPCAATSDGRIVYVSTKADTGQDLWIVANDGSDAAPLLDTEWGERTCALSPDGRWLAYESNADGVFGVFVAEFPNVAASAKINVSQGPGEDPRWARDSSELYFRLGNQLMATEPPAEGAAWSSPSALVEIDFASRDHAGYDTLPDGGFLAVERVDWSDTMDVVVVENFSVELEKLLPSD